MITISEIAELIDGEVIGDGSVEIKKLSHPRFAAEGEMTFAVDKETLSLAKKNNAACILTIMDIKEYGKTILKVKDMKIATTMLYNVLRERDLSQKEEIHPSAVIAEDVKIGQNIFIGPNVVVEKGAVIGDHTSIKAGCFIGEKVIIGKKCCLNPNVTIYEHTEISDRVILHAGVVIGADGFGYIPKDGKIYKVPQMGKVVIGENVEIGANTCIDRGTFDTTVIGKNTKIDNLVQIAHNVKIGEGVFMAALNGIAGSVVIGDNVMLGGMAGVSDHVHIAKDKKIAAKAGVIGNIEETDPDEYFGYPARGAKDAMKQVAFLAWLYKNAVKIRKVLKDVSEK